MDNKYAALPFEKTNFIVYMLPKYPHDGWIINVMSHDKGSFRDLGELLLTLDELCDNIGYPLAAQPKTALELSSAAQRGMQHFAVRVLFRQNNSLQGYLMNGERRINFRSGLELLQHIREQFCD